jgi:hypothetical protein
VLVVLGMLLEPPLVKVGVVITSWVVVSGWPLGPVTVLVLFEVVKLVLVLKADGPLVLVEPFPVLEDVELVELVFEVLVDFEVEVLWLEVVVDLVLDEVVFSLLVVLVDRVEVAVVVVGSCIC